MGLVSHAEERRAMIRRAGLPPTPTGRQCSAVTVITGSWTYELENGRTNFQKPMWREGRELPCRSGCSAYVPEINYCAHHLPTEWVVIANARAELWARFTHDIWEQVCAEYPPPT